MTAIDRLRSPFTRAFASPSLVGWVVSLGLLVSSSVHAQSPMPAKQEGLRWERTSGEVQLAPMATQAAVPFAFQNKTTRPVTILSLSTSCHCLHAVADKKFYQPGERGVVTVTFAPLPNQAQATTGEVLVETDAPGSSKAVLTVKASIQAVSAGQLEPSSLTWAAGEPLQPKTIKLRVPEGMPIRNVSVSSTDLKAFTAQVEPLVGGREYRITATPAVGAKGDAEAKLIVHVEAGNGRPGLLLAMLRLRQTNP